MSEKRKVTVVLIPASEGGFVAYAPALGWVTQGESEAEALRMAKDMIEAMLEEATEDDLGALDFAYAPGALLGSVEVDVPARGKVPDTR